nr:hypothetical protein [Escherichia coli]
MHFAQRVRALVVLNGVALLPQFACKQGLANGELVRLFAPWSGIPRPLYALFAGRSCICLTRRTRLPLSSIKSLPMNSCKRSVLRASR